MRRFAIDREPDKYRWRLYDRRGPFIAFYKTRKLAREARDRFEPVLVEQDRQ